MPSSCFIVLSKWVLAPVRSLSIYSLEAGKQDSTSSSRASWWSRRYQQQRQLFCHSCLPHTTCVFPFYAGCRAEPCLIMFSVLPMSSFLLKCLTLVCCLSHIGHRFCALLLASIPSTSLSKPIYIAFLFPENSLNLCLTETVDQKSCSTWRPGGSWDQAVSYTLYCPCTVAEYVPFECCATQ